MNFENKEHAEKIAAQSRENIIHTAKQIAKIQGLPYDIMKDLANHLRTLIKDTKTLCNCEDFIKWN